MRQIPDASGTGLGAYVRDVRRVSLLNRDQSLNLAKLVIRTRRELWCAILDYAPRTNAVLSEIIGEGIAEKLGAECEAVSAAASRRLEGLCGDVEFAAACRKLADALSYRKGVCVARRIATTFATVDGDPYDVIAHSGLLCSLLREHDIVRQRFAAANLRLVISVAKRMRSRIRTMPLQDMIQEGSFGLLRAVDTFDPRKGFSFATYATWWIRHMMIRGAVDRGRLVRIPQHMHDRAYRLFVTARAIYKRTGEWPSPEETAEAAGLGMAKAMRAYEVFGGNLLGGEEGQVVSMDGPSRGGGDDDRGGPAPEETMASVDHGAMGPEEAVDAVMTVDAALVAVETAGLTDREKHVLRQRMGLATGDTVNLDVIGKELSLSRERVRQIELSALTKIRSALGVDTSRAAA